MMGSKRFIWVRFFLILLLCRRLLLLYYDGDDDNYGDDEYTNTFSAYCSFYSYTLLSPSPSPSFLISLYIIIITIIGEFIDAACLKYLWPTELNGYRLIFILVR